MFKFFVLYLAFSTAVDNPTIAKLFRNVESIVTHEGLTINENKTRILRANKRQEVTGIVVNNKLNIDRKTLKNFRALLFQIEQDIKQNPLNPLKGFEGKKWGNTDNIIASIRGFINFVTMVNPEKGAKLKTILNRIINPTKIIEQSDKILHPIEEQNLVHSNENDKKDAISGDSAQKIEQKDINIEIVQEEKRIILECYKKGKDLKVKVISAGYNQDWNVRFPNDLKEEGTRYSVEEIKESSRKYYTVSGIKKLTSETITVSPANIEPNKSSLSATDITDRDKVEDNLQNIDDLDNQITQTPEIIKTINLQDSQINQISEVIKTINLQNPKYIVLECYKKGKDLKVRVISEGYNSELNVRFPRNLRKEGVYYHVETIEEMKGKYYIAKGNITKINEDLDSLK